MNTHYIDFQKSDIADLKDLVNNCSKLSLDAKLALQSLIQEVYINNEFTQEQIQKLDDSINSSRNEIKKLKLLNKLGIDLFEDKDGISIRKSKSARIGDIIGIIFASILMLFFFASLMSWIEIFTIKFEILKFVLATIMTLIGAYGLALLIRIIDRVSFFKGFVIQKDIRKIILKYKPNMGLEQFDYSLDARLELQDIKDVTLLNINENQNTRTILQFKNLGTIAKESLVHMSNKFNNLV